MVKRTEESTFRDRQQKNLVQVVKAQRNEIESIVAFADAEKRAFDLNLNQKQKTIDKLTETIQQLKLHHTEECEKLKGQIEMLNSRVEQLEKSPPEPDHMKQQLQRYLIRLTRRQKELERQVESEICS